MRKLITGIAVVLGLVGFITGCASPPQSAKTFERNQTVTHEGIQFQISDLGVVTGGQYSPPAGSGNRLFYVGVNVKSLLNQPVPFQFLPKFRLMSQHGFYEPHQMATIQLGFQHGVNSLDSLNPMVSIMRPVAFLVPPGQYNLEVSVPTAVRYNMFSSQTQSDRFFFNLGTLN